MIISHKHKFIFIKTHKTAGTSIEIALSKYCGPLDVITPITPEDEKIRSELGYRGPQNCDVAFRNYSLKDIYRLLAKRKKLRFHNHASAQNIMRHIDRDVWENYYCFCFERNPWDKAISLYYWLYKEEPRPTIEEFLGSGELSRLKRFDQYATGSSLLVDRVYLYENLDDSMADICQRLDLPEVPSLPRAKGSFRKDRRNYRDVFNEEGKRIVAEIFAREIENFDYKW